MAEWKPPCWCLLIWTILQSTEWVNSPICVVGKKNRGIWLVQDFRTVTPTPTQTMKDVSKCIVDIVRYGSMITIHLTTGFWKLLLHPRAWPYTTFIVPRQEKYQWVTTKIVLIGAPASFQWLMETMVHSLPNVIVYINVMLLHSSTHPKHLEQLDALLHQLMKHRIKVNLPKCELGSKEVTYLGFWFTNASIIPSTFSTF